MSEPPPKSVEPDLVTHICNVLDDYRNGLLDGRDDAADAILGHPAIKRALALKVVGSLDSAPRKPNR